MPKSEEADGSFITGKVSYMSLDKSKVSPEIKNIPIRIDVTKGGVIDERGSFFEFCIECIGFFVNNGGWYTLTDKFSEWVPGYENRLEAYTKKYRYNDLKKRFCATDELYNLARLGVANYIASLYSLQKEIMKDYRETIIQSLEPPTEIGSPTDAD